MVLSSRNITQATFVILNILIAILKSEKKQRKLILFILIKHLTQYTQNIIIPTCKQYKKKNTDIFYFFFFKYYVINIQCVFYVYNTAQIGLATL